MDKDTRNRIQRATQDARALLEREYGEQLEGVFDIRLDGTIAREPGSHLDARQRVLRAKLVAAVEHVRAGGIGPAEAVGAYLREAAFTTLNRFVALKMLEARGLVQECISRGDQSPGFKEFTGLAPGLVQLPDHGYRLYVESIFDEIGREVRVLFDRRDPASLLWPRRQALQDLLTILNATELAGVWDQDETIGWVYQYFNSDDERKQMRAESQAPRNSRELAVRNQFFTPRYVVQFLTDNTLGRIWYEMRKGDTQLRDLDYLVRRPNEVFLSEGKEAPADADAGDEELSQEELLERPVHVPFRAKKDPRDIRVLDPACGSGHFLLYAFDLLLAIYEETWADDASPASDATGRTLREDYADLDTLRAAAPGLILRHNLHGIDIDSRCAQIAALALWMRAQRAFKELGIARDARPAVQKTNIVVAEPMPGNPDLRREFVATLEPKLGQLVERVFDRMELAGEAGSLLRIEDDIRDAVREILGEYGDLFRASDEERWQEAEKGVLQALRGYAERAANGRAFQRRLFADDAVRGFGFIDACVRRYDTALMNPPFGQGTSRGWDLLQTSYEGCHNDLYSAFVARGLELTRGATTGRVGAITSRSFLVARRQEAFRSKTVLSTLELLMDLGGSVMDDAFVESAAYILNASSPLSLFALDARSEKPQRPGVAAWSLVRREGLSALPQARILYGLPDRVLDLLQNSPRFEPAIGTAREGMKTFDNERFLRLRWEVPSASIRWDDTWRTYAKGGEHAFYLGRLPLLLKWNGDGRELQAVNLMKNGSTAQVRQASTYWGRPGATYSRRSAAGFSVRALPSEAVFSDKGPAVLSNTTDVGPSALLAWLNSRLIRALVHLQANASDFMTGIVKSLPWIAAPADQQRALEEFATAITTTLLRERAYDELSPYFLRPLLSSFDGQRIVAVEPEVSALRSRIDDLVDRVYGTSSAAWASDLLGSTDEESNDSDDDEEDDDEVPTTIGKNQVAASLVPWAVGVALGRFDVRSAIDQTNRAEGAPFAPLPPCSPGMLKGDNGLPVEIPPPGYPVALPRDAVLVDEQGHDHDLVARARKVFQIVFGDAADARWREVAECLEPREGSLRIWFAGAFFEEHIKRYSKSRRKAPIYWQLATPSASYSVWLYYHRFTRDTFYRLLNDYVAPKLKHEERKLTSLTQGAGPNPSASQRRETDTQETLVSELRAFHGEVARVAPLWNPDLNDGVVINFAPLWRLVPQHRGWQKECKKAWDKLVKGDYDWAHLAVHLWPERVVPKCAKDRSLAIAHGLEDELWFEDGDGKWQPRKVNQATIDNLIKERASAAVKDALKKLLDAPAPATTRASKRKKAARRSGSRRAASSRPEASNGAPEPGKRGSAGGEVLDKVKEAIAQNGDGASKAEVLEATGISAGQWNAAIKALLADGVVVQTGERRGARYHVAETGGES